MVLWNNISDDHQFHSLGPDNLIDNMKTMNEWRKTDTLVDFILVASDGTKFSGNFFLAYLISILLQFCLTPKPKAALHVRHFLLKF